MTIAGIVARPHCVSGFDAGPGVYQGLTVPFTGAGSVLIEVNVKNPEPPPGSIEGYLVTSNFFIGRIAGSPLRFVFATGPDSRTFDVEPSAALDRSFLLGLSSDGVATTHITINGAIVGSLPALQATDGSLSLGGAQGLNCRDRIVLAAMGSTVYNDQQWADLWTNIRRYAEISSALPEYYYQALHLDPREETSAPATWENQGTAGASANLTLTDTATLVFEDDPHGAFTGLILPYTSNDPVLAPLDIYLSTTGADFLDGLSPATAVATLLGAYSKIPSSRLGAPVRFHVASGTYDWATIPGFQAVNPTGEFLLLGDGGGQGGDDGFGIVTSAVAGPATTGTSIDLADTADTYNGLWIRFTSGPAVGQIRQIRNNTNAAIIPCAEFSPAPNPGDSFDVVFSNVVFTASTTDANLATEGEVPITFMNVIVASDGGEVQISNQPCFKLYGVGMPDTVAIRGSSAFSGVSATDQAVSSEPMYLETTAAAIASSPVPFYTTLQKGWGLTAFGALQTVNTLLGYVVCSNAVETVQNHASSTSALTFLGGALLGGLHAQGAIDVCFQPNSQVPTLLRSSPGFSLSVDDALSSLFIGGGDRSLVIEDASPTPGMPTIFAAKLIIDDTFSFTSASDNYGLLALSADTLDVSITMTNPAALAALDVNVAGRLSGGNYTLQGPGGTNMYGLFTDATVSMSGLDISGVWIGVGSYDASVRVGGNATITADNYGIAPTANSTFTVQGDLTITAAQDGDCFGVFALASEIFVGGAATVSATATGISPKICAALRLEDAEMTVIGNGAFTTTHVNTDEGNLLLGAVNCIRSKLACKGTNTITVNQPNSTTPINGAIFAYDGSVVSIFNAQTLTDTANGIVGIYSWLGSVVDYIGLIDKASLAYNLLFHGTIVAQGTLTNCATLGVNLFGTLTFSTGAAITSQFGFVTANGGKSDILLGDINTSLGLGICADNSQATITCGDGTYGTPSLPGNIFTVACSSTIFSATTMVGDGSVAWTQDNSNLTIGPPSAMSVQSNLADALVARTGSQISFTDYPSGNVVTIAAPAGNGINCTGGGKCTFSDVANIAFGAIGGAELVVGPNPLESSSLALALPNPGDSFSNAGAGSNFTRAA